LLGKKTITLDFDGRDIRLLITKGRKVVRWASVTVPPELMHQGLIKEPELMGTGLIRFLSTHKASRRGIITSVTGHRSVSRLLSLPAIKPDLLEDAVRRKAKQEMPLPLEETYLSWQVMGREDSQLQIFALAVPRLIIDRHVETLRAAKIKLGSMDIKPLALVRAVAQSDAIIINLEEQSLGVIIVRNGVPVLIRSMPQTSEKVELESATERLSLELSRTTQFFNESHRDNPLDEKTVVYMTGAPFDQKKTREAFASRISNPVEIPMPPMLWPKDFPLSTYIVNLGIAMKGV
jgi:type IV pilus assembly protein PilM